MVCLYCPLALLSSDRCGNFVRDLELIKAKSETKSKGIQSIIFEVTGMETFSLIRE